MTVFKNQPTLEIGEMKARKNDWRARNHFFFSRNLSKSCLLGRTKNIFVLPNHLCRCDIWAYLMYAQISWIRPFFFCSITPSIPCIFEILTIQKGEVNRWNNQQPCLRIPCWRSRIYGQYLAAASGRHMNWYISQDFQQWSWAENNLSAPKLWRIGSRKTQEKESENKWGVQKRKTIFYCSNP